MNSNLAAEAVQVEDAAEIARQRIRNSPQIYVQRKDILGIKSRLLSLVPDPIYWETLSKFVNGECSKVKFDEVIAKQLKTNEMRILHNELIRSILFNAHFSTVPPPGVFPVQKQEQKADVRPVVPNRTFATYSASDLGHLHSPDQLSARVAVLLKGSKMKMEARGLMVLLVEVKRYAATILRRSLELAAAGRASHGLKISAGNVEFVLRNHAYLGPPASPMGPRFH